MSGLAQSAARARRADLLAAALGYITETYPRALRPTTAAMATGRMYYMPVALLAGETVGNIDVGCHSAGSSLSLVKFGVISLDFATLHATSGDEKAQYATTGLKTNAMLSPYTSPIDQVLYACGIAVGTTGPTVDVVFGTGRNSNGKRSGAAAGALMSVAGKSDLTTGGTPVGDGNGLAIWLGLAA